MATDLAAVVASERRLDQALARAREQAAASVAAARQRVAVDDDALAAAIDRERARVTAELEAETEAQLRAIADAGRDECARFDAMRDDALAPLARRLAARLVALALDEVPR